MRPIVVTSPSVLTPTIFADYGGETGTAAAGQITAAFCVAEQLAIEEVGTPLVPTAITGSTYHWLAYGSPMALMYDRLLSIDQVILTCESSCTDCSVTEYEKCAHIKSALYGIIELRLKPSTISSCGACGACGSPVVWMVDYTAGLGLGELASAPTALLALTTLADLALQQITDPSAAEGGAGDPGVQSWGSMSYRETRVPLLRTVLGTSARANYAKTLLAPWHLKRPIKLRY